MSRRPDIIISGKDRHAKVVAWWKEGWRGYNKGVMGAGIIAIFVCSFVGFAFTIDFFSTILTTLLHGLLIVAIMVVANIFYLFGIGGEVIFNIFDSERFRSRLFNFFYIFSAMLQIVVPLVLLVGYYWGYFDLSPFRAFLELAR